MSRDIYAEYKELKSKNFFIEKLNWFGVCMVPEMFFAFLLFHTAKLSVSYVEFVPFVLAGLVAYPCLAVGAMFIYRDIHQKENRFKHLKAEIERNAALDIG